MSVYCSAAVDEESPSKPQVRSTLSIPTPSSAPDTDRAVREFEAICGKHNLHCGAPEDLAGFLSALGSNKLLAMNFWSVVARLSEPKNGVALDSAGLLAVIVRAVTGRSIEETKAADGALVDRLTRLLAGEDVQLTAGSAHRQSEPKIEQPQIEPESFPERQKNRHPQTGSQANASSAANASPLTVFEAPDDDPAPDLPPQPRPDRFYGQRLSLRPDLSSSSAQHSYRNERGGSVSAFGSLAGYTDTDDRHRTSRRIAAAVLVLTLGVGAWLYFSRGYSAWQEPGNTARAAITDFGGRGAAAFSRISGSVRAGFDSARDTWRGQTDSPQTANTGPLANGSQAPTPAPASPAGGPEQPATAAPPQSPVAEPALHDDASTTRATGREEASARRRARNNPDAEIVGDSNSTHGGEMVVVPGALMRDRLLSSRVPILPDGVPSRHAFVVVHAVVTSRGTVRDVSAVMGRPDLQQAAIDAVSAWRYRPYLLNGTPVDVATTITVNFDGND